MVGKEEEGVDEEEGTGLSYEKGHLGTDFLGRFLTGT